LRRRYNRRSPKEQGGEDAGALSARVFCGCVQRSANQEHAIKRLDGVGLKSVSTQPFRIMFRRIAE
jgi:hypothetical protein